MDLVIQTYSENAMVDVGNISEIILGIHKMKIKTKRRLNETKNQSTRNGETRS